MANERYEALFRKYDHGVGVINSSWAKEVTNGCRLTVANADNYTLVEFDGYDTDGVLKCKPLTDKTKVGHVLSTVEEESLFGDGSDLIQGNYTDFYNKQGDMVKVTYSEPRLRMEVSNFELNTGNTKIALGQVAHYDIAKKAYIVSKSATDAHADFATAGNKYEVAGIDTDFGVNMEKTTIRLERI